MDQQPYSQQQGYMPPPPQQQGYMPPQQPLYNSNPYMNDKTAPMTMGQYLVMFLILMIPIVNLVMPFVWAFGDTNLNKKNLAKAMLVMMAISIVLGILFSSIFAAIFRSVFSSM